MTDHQNRPPHPGLWVERVVTTLFIFALGFAVGEVVGARIVAEKHATQPTLATMCAKQEQKAFSLVRRTGRTVTASRHLLTLLSEEDVDDATVLETLGDDLDSFKVLR